MDIEKIKKINEMSKSLRTHHFAIDSQDATSDAQKIFDDIIPEKTTETGTPMPSPSIHSPSESQPINIPLIEKKFQILLDQNVKSFKDDLRNLQDTVEFLQQELSKMHQRVSKLQQPVKIVQQDPVKEEQVTQVVQEQPVEHEKEETTSHPRSGNLTSSDVSIEKFFYYGNSK